MGRDFVVTNSNSIEIGKRKKTVGRQIVIGPNAIKFITIIIVAVLAVVYLNQSTAGANQSIKIRDIEDHKSELILEQERLQSEQTRLKALKEIDSSVTPEEQNLQPVSQVDHLNANSALARSY